VADPAGPAAAGYSGKPLAVKLGVRPGVPLAVCHPPADFAATLGGAAGMVVPVTPGGQGAAPVVLVFSRAAAALAADFPPTAAALAPGGALWVAWPKKAARVATDLTEDVVRAIGLANGLVDVKVCAIDAVWSGLKFMRRRAPA